MLLQCFDIAGGKSSRDHFVVGEITNFHVIIHQKRNGDYIFSVQFFTDHAAADGVTVQPDQQVEQGGAVTD